MSVKYIIFVGSSVKGIVGQWKAQNTSSTAHNRLSLYRKKLVSFYPPLGVNYDHGRCLCICTLGLYSWPKQAPNVHMCLPVPSLKTFNSCLEWGWSWLWALSLFEQLYSWPRPCSSLLHYAFLQLVGKPAVYNKVEINAVVWQTSVPFRGEGSSIGVLR